MALIEIGTTVSKDAIDPLVDAIVRILDADGDQKTKRHALSILARTMKVEGVTIANCNVTGDRSVNIDMDDPALRANYADPSSTAINAINAA